MNIRNTLRRWVSSPSVSPFIPKIVVCLLEGYTKQTFLHDLMAGVTVGVIALPLAMAFSIGAGLGPEKGLYTAIVAGFLNSLFGGSRFLIGGPTGAYVILIFGVVQKFGYEGVLCATIQAAIMLFLLGIFRCGTLIRFISYPVIVGFTTGIALVLMVSQINDFFGLQVPVKAADAISRVSNGITYAATTNWYAVLIGSLTLALIVGFRRISSRFPGVIVALAITTLLTAACHFPISTIESTFGIIPAKLPSLQWPSLSLDLIRQTFPDAVGIALLGAIESLLCAVIADSLAGTRHKSNCELIAQGISNFGSALYGGIPSTGAIARTTASMQLQARTPFAGIIHSITLLVLMLVLAPLASKIPLAALSSVLIFVAWNMLELEHMKDLLKAHLGEALVMLITLSITILIDLNAAVQAGVLLSIILFLKRSSEATTGKLLQAIQEDERLSDTSMDGEGSWEYSLPPDTKIYEIEGPFFFAVADLLSDVLSRFETLPKTLILRMRSVPFIDATAINALKRFSSQCKMKGVTLCLAELSPSVQKSLEEFKFFESFPKERVITSLDNPVLPT